MHLEAELDKRKFARMPVDIVVRCGEVNGSRLKGRALNLSTGGLFLITAESIVLGARLSVEFLLPGSLTPTHLTGELVWCRSYNDETARDKPPHVAGIKFIGSEDSRCRFLHHYNEFCVRLLGFWAVPVKSWVCNLPGSSSS